MKPTYHSNKIIIEIISLLFVLLFLYAAVSKILDFENFQVQLGQSPLLSAYSFWISRLVPSAEILIAIALMVPRWRMMGLLAAFNLMIMFTVYIFIILNFSSFVPCSCGGILEKMTWQTHLIFNIVFVVLAFCAFLFEYQRKEKAGILRPLVSIPLSAVLSSAVIVILFLGSEKIMHYSNPFLRRFDRRAVSFVRSKDLKFNSYYFSGFSNGNVYLGNYSTPLRVISFDNSLKYEKAFKVSIENRNIPFRAIKVLVRAKEFYLTDGTVPCVYFGNTQDWKARGVLKNIPRFTAGEPIDTTAFILRNNSVENSANVIGLYHTKKEPGVLYSPSLLQRQIDGIFDTDGMLHYDAGTAKMVYVYFYRNQFITADNNINLLQRGNTIDTISKAQIKVAVLHDGKRKKMAVPPLVVNAQSALSNNLLFIESRIRGQRENEEMWKYASIIDVYNLENNSYVLSFPIFGTDSHKMSSFAVNNTHFYALIGTRLTIYKLNSILRKEMKKQF